MLTSHEERPLICLSKVDASVKTSLKLNSQLKIAENNLVYHNKRLCKGKMTGVAYHLISSPIQSTQEVI